MAQLPQRMLRSRTIAECPLRIPPPAWRAEFAAIVVLMIVGLGLFEKNSPPPDSPRFPVTTDPMISGEESSPKRHPPPSSAVLPEIREDVIVGDDRYPKMPPPAPATFPDSSHAVIVGEASKPHTPPPTSATLSTIVQPWIVGEAPYRQYIPPPPSIASLPSRRQFRITGSTSPSHVIPAPSGANPFRMVNPSTMARLSSPFAKHTPLPRPSQSITVPSAPPLDTRVRPVPPKFRSRFSIPVYVPGSTSTESPSDAASSALWIVG